MFGLTSRTVLWCMCIAIAIGAVRCSANGSPAPDGYPVDRAAPADLRTERAAWPDLPGDGPVQDVTNADRHQADELAMDDLQSPDLAQLDVPEDQSEVVDPDNCGNGDLADWIAIPGEGYGFLMECDTGDLMVDLLADSVVRFRRMGSSPQFDHSYAVQYFPWPEPTVQYGLVGDELRVCTNDLFIRIRPGTCRVTARDPDGNVLLDEAPGGGYFESQDTLDGAPVTTRNLVRLTPANERFYGFGEKNGPLDKRGMSLTFWNSDTPGYPADMDPLYQSIPFFIGLRGTVAYGVFVDNSYRMEFDMAAAQSDRYRLTAYGGEIDTYLIAGPEMSTVLERYTGLTGRMPMPPRWTLGYHQCRWSYYPDNQVLDICQQFRTRGIPADGIWLDIDYMDGYRSWTWNPEGFSDPAGFVAEAEAIGFKVTAIIDPGLKEDPAWDIYQAGVEGGHFLMDSDGEPFVGEVWPGASVYPDFSHSATRAWWAGLVPGVTDHGVRGIWLDMNEPANFLAEHGYTVPGDVAAAGESHPTTMAEIHNVYALLEGWATYEGMSAAVPERRPFLLTRAGFAGSQRYTATWTGDAPSDTDALASVLPMLMGLGLSGSAFVGSDVGGWTGGATPELFARWIQVGSVSPFFRGHVQTGAIDQEPWAFGVEVEDISRLAIGLRYRLLPYLYSLFREASLSGAPILRPLVYEFQQQQTLANLGTQAMLGPWLMFAPVTETGAESRTVVLPDGEWLEYHSGALYAGGKEISVSVTLQALPVFMRAGAIVPMSQLMMYADQVPVDPIYLELFPAGEATSFVLYEDAGDGPGYQDGEHARLTYELQRTAAGAVLSAGVRQGTYQIAPRTMAVRVRRVDQGVAAVTLDGEPLAALDSLEQVQAGATGYFHDGNDLSLWVVMPDQDDFELSMTYDTATPASLPEVLVPLLVKLPPGTSKDTPVHIATSAADWAQQPLEWGTEPDTAVGLVPVPRGEWFHYKYTRGDWDTVEKWGGCLETTNRYAFGMAHPVKEDTVEMWADECK